MQKTRLNLQTLRRWKEIQRTAFGSHLLDGLSNATNLSRRGFLQLSGAAAVGAEPTLRLIDAALRGPLELVETDQRVIFKIGGRRLWVIDTRRFAGSPLLETSKTEDLIRVELKNARYPGTELPADLVCELRHGVTGWWMKLSLALGGFHSEVPFESWLAGTAAAQSMVQFDTVVCRLRPSSDCTFRLCGAGQAEFFPNWTLRIHGSNLATLRIFGQEVASELLELSLLDPGAESILRKAEAKRTLISLKRGERVWPYEPNLPLTDVGRLVWEDNLFDGIQIEAGESPTGLARRALVAKSGASAKLSFQPAGDLKTPEGEPFALPLRDARYAVAFDPFEEQTALLADFDENPVWMQAEGVSLQLGSSAETPQFEWIGRGRRLDRLCCEPALLRASAPLPGAIVEPAEAPEGTRIEFIPTAAQQTPARPPSMHTRPQRQQPRPKVGQVRISPQRRIPAELVLPNLPISVVRPEDLLVLRFAFENMKLQTGGGQKARLVRMDVNKPAHLTVEFPPQSIGEQAFWEKAPEFQEDEDEKPEPPPVGARISGPSRLVFTVPAGIQEIPYRLEALLRACTEYEQKVSLTAQPPPAPPARVVLPGQPAWAGRPLELRREPQQIRPSVSSAIPAGLTLIGKIEDPKGFTAIEVPWRLVLSPNKFAAWVHSTASVAGASSKRIELWHTRLGVRSNDGGIYDGKYTYRWNPKATLRVSDVTVSENEHYRTLRAIWSPDYNPTHIPDHKPFPFRMSLDAADRYQLVRLTSDFSIGGCAARIIQANRLMLSSLGAWMDSRYAAAPPVNPQGLEVEEWRHQMTMGRDHYVRVVYKGYLFPFGHSASLVKVTERKFEPSPSGNIAYLRQRMYIIVREPERDYPAFGHPNNGRLMPFRNVRITTLVTPDLNPPEKSSVPGVKASPQSAFWPHVGNQEFQFHLVGEDWDGQRSDFTAPLIFVGVEQVKVSNVQEGVAFNLEAMTTIRDHYNKLALDSSKRARPFSGQKVAFADSAGKAPGHTTLETVKVTFGAELDFDPAVPSDKPIDAPSLAKQNQPRCYPTVAQAEVRIPAVDQVAGPGEAAKIKIHSSYVKSGWAAAANKGELFAELVAQKAMNYKADKSGGVATPSLSISGLSRSFGPVGGKLDDLNALANNALAEGTNYFKDFFSGIEAKILGGLDLFDILENSFGGGGNVPKLITTPIYPGGNKNAPPEAIKTVLEWTPKVQPDPLKLFNPLNPAPQKTNLSLQAILLTQLNGKDEPSYDIQGKLVAFTMDLFGFITLTFKSLDFTAKSGKKLDFSADIDKVEFGGPLAFVNELKDFLGGSGFKDPPSLDITPTGVKVGFSLGIPTISVGVMSIQNISLGAGLHLPFTGDPVRLRFWFCERENQFLLTVYVFGGGGFVGLALGLDGVELLEAGLEFGGNIGIDIGVASGGVYIMAGIYFKWEDQGALLTGYLRLGGGLEILGIIVISLEFYMGLTYESGPNGGKVWGEATLTVQIEILFFSLGVEMSVRREFADPERATFAKLMSKSQWDTYCEAFA